MKNLLTNFQIIISGNQFNLRYSDENSPVHVYDTLPESHEVSSCIPVIKMIFFNFRVAAIGSTFVDFTDDSDFF